MLIWVGLILLAGPFAAHAQIDNPFDKPDPAEWRRADIAALTVRLLHDDDPRKSELAATFDKLARYREIMRSEQAPYRSPMDDYYKQVIEYNTEGDKYHAELARYDQDGAAFTADDAAYRAAGGGGTVSQAAYPALHAWYGRLDAWHQRRDEWRIRVENWRLAYRAEYERLIKIKLSLQADVQASFLNWTTNCTSFAVKVDDVVKRVEIEEKIAALKIKIRSDLRELNMYKTKLPGLHADVEAMANAADDAREEGQMAAIDKAVGLALDGVASSMNARELLARGQLRQVKDILINSGVHPDDAKKVLLGWFDHPNSVQSIKHTKELIEQLSTLKDVAAAYDATTKMQYYEALATCLGLFVKTPMLKLAITNFEVYSNLLYTGLSYATARARVNQYAKLADSELLAVAKISALYKKHLRELAELEKELQSLGV